MALETTLIYELEPPVPLTCADGVGIEKGALLLLTDPATVATTTGDSDEIVGIAAEEKIANDGRTKISVYLRGVFRGFAGAGGTVAGKAIQSDTATGAANELVIGDTNTEQLVGTAWETAADTESFLFLLQPITIELV